MLSATSERYRPLLWYLWNIFVLFSICPLEARAYEGSSTSSGDHDLKFVAILLRHSDRSPVNPYPNDPYLHYQWPGGYEALSPKGIQQSYESGKNLRIRYKKLLPADGFYSAENMRVVSSFKERCIMSVQSLLAGLMPPDDCLNRLPFPWQPVAITSIPADSDYMLYQLKSSCPIYDILFNKYLTDPDPDTAFAEYNAQLKKIYAYLTKYSGQNITNALQTTLFQDTLFIEDYNDLELPAWTKPVYPSLLHHVRGRTFELFTETKYMKQIRGGPFITDVFTQMQQKQNHSLTRNFAIYSAHDTTLVNVMNSLGVLSQTTNTPEYGAILTLELHCDENDECYVKVYFYFDTNEKKPKELKIPNCPEPCSLSQFGDAISDLLVYDIAAACGCGTINAQISKPTDIFH